MSKKAIVIPWSYSLAQHFTIVKIHFQLQDSTIVVYSPHHSFLRGRLFHAPQRSPFYYHLAKSHRSARESPAQPGKAINHGPALTQAAPRNEISPVLTLCMGINPPPSPFYLSVTHTSAPSASMTHIFRWISVCLWQSHKFCSVREQVTKVTLSFSIIHDTTGIPLGS